MKWAVTAVWLAASSTPAQTALTGPQIAERVGWLEANAIRINSIDPERDDFADLQPLKEKIGDARVVLLGEQTHGDGAVFVAKDRLVRFLHQEMGFDVLAWESPLYEVRRMERRLRDHTIPIPEATAYGVFQIWTYSAQVRPVFEYARATHGTERPLEMAGFDMQTGDAKWLEDVRAMFLALGEGAMPDDIGAILDEAPPLTSGQGVTAEQIGGAYRERLARVGAFMDGHAAALAEKHTQREYDFMRRSLRDRLAMLESTQQHLAAQVGGPEPDHWRRDQLMGENLVWLADERYKGRKIIVWLATMHGVHDAPSIEFPGRPGFYAGTVTAGSVAKPILGDDMYTIGFTALEGAAGNVWSDGWELPAAPFGSFEALAGMVGRPFLFVDFAGLPPDHWLRESVSMRPLGYVDMKAVWPEQMDAVVFIRTMFPSTQGRHTPDGYALTVEP